MKTILSSPLFQRKQHSVRTWHLWVGVLLALPILIVGLTAVLIAHDKALGLKQIELGTAATPQAETELRQFLQTADGRLWIASKQGLWLQAEGKSHAVAGPGELRSLASDGAVLMAAGKNGLWRVPLSAAAGAEPQSELRAERVLKADVFGVARVADGWLANAKQEVYRAPADGRSFGRDALLEAQMAELPVQAKSEAMTVSKLVMDLHTGKFFFGKQGEWIWIDVLGLALTLFTLSGLLLWLRRERAQATLRHQAQAPQAAAEGTRVLAV